MFRVKNDVIYMEMCTKSAPLDLCRCYIDSSSHVSWTCQRSCTGGVHTVPRIHRLPVNSVPWANSSAPQ
jgi:hypothetical protein